MRSKMVSAGRASIRSIHSKGMLFLVKLSMLKDLRGGESVFPVSWLMDGTFIDEALEQMARRILFLPDPLGEGRKR